MLHIGEEKKTHTHTFSRSSRKTLKLNRPKSLSLSNGQEKKNQTIQTHAKFITSKKNQVKKK